MESAASGSEKPGWIELTLSMAGSVRSADQSDKQCQRLLEAKQLKKFIE